MQTNQVGNTYADRRRWADGYTTAMNMLANELLQTANLITPTFLPPTLFEDARQGIDMWVQFDRIKLAYRVRKYAALPFVLDGFSLRRKYGERSELNKVMGGGHADYMVYAVASEADDGTLHSGILIDLKSAGAQLMKCHSILEKAIWQPDYVDLNYDLFPDDVCVAWKGISKIRKVH